MREEYEAHLGCVGFHTFCIVHILMSGSACVHTLDKSSRSSVSLLCFTLLLFCSALLFSFFYFKFLAQSSLSFSLYFDSMPRSCWTEGILQSSKWTIQRFVSIYVVGAAPTQHCAAAYSVSADTLPRWSNAAAFRNCVKCLFSLTGRL